MVRRWQQKLATALKLGLHATMEDDAARAAAVEAVSHALAHALIVNEDVLTAMLFERLRYLSAALAWEIVVRGAEELRGAAPNLEAGSFDVDLWPRVTLADDKDVVPDVLWITPPRVPHLVVGIEVKWRDRQTVAQIQREYEAIRAKYAYCEIVMLALGGAGRQGLVELRAGTTCPVLLFLDWAALAMRLRGARDRAPLGSAEHWVCADLLGLLSLRSPLLGREVLMLTSMPRWRLSFEADMFPRLTSDSRRYLATLPSAQFPNRPWEEWRPL